MSIELDALRVVHVDTEDAGSYNTTQTFPGDFLQFPYKEGTLEIAGNQEMLDPAVGTVCIDGMPAAKIPGIKSCTATLTSVLHSHGQDLDGDVTPATADQWALRRVLNAVMGGSVTTTNASAQTTVQAGSTTTVVNVTTGHGARFQAGGVIGCLAGGTTLELREIASVSTDAITVRKAFSATPSGVVRGGTTHYLTSDPDTSLQLVVEGRELSDRILLRGLQGGFGLTVTPGQLPEISFSLVGATWSMLSDGGSVPSCPSFSYFGVPVASASELLFAAHSGTTRTAMDWSAVTLTPNLTYAPVKSGGATDTVKRMKRQRSVPVLSGSFVVPFEDSGFWSTWSAGTYQMLCLQIGTFAGSAVLVTVPKVQIVNVQRTASDSGIAGQTVSFEATEDSLGTTDILKSAIRIHFV